jgi:hypothetical protein
VRHVNPNPFDQRPVDDSKPPMDDESDDRNDHHHHAFDFEVIPGPGPVAQATISSAQGGTITVAGAGNPLNGTQVVIPPGALGDPTDTITIGYANVLPAALNAKALAAGVIPVSDVVTLNRQGTTPLQQLVTVTIPYAVTGLGTQDYPTMVYWEPTIQNYQPVQVTSIDQKDGLIIFVTKHFSSYVALDLPGLGRALMGLGPFAPQLMDPLTTFNPQNDDFEASNFTTAQPGLGSLGVCFGLASYAGWYFAAQPGQSRLFQEYAAQSDPGLVHVPQEDAIARELLAKTYVDTVGLRLPQFALTQLQTTEQFIEQMLNTGDPQLVYLNDGRNAHSVLIYSWNASSQSFAVYDPNAPYPQVSNAIQWSTTKGESLSWNENTPSGIYSWANGSIYFDAYGSHYDPLDLNLLFSSVLAGGPPTDTNGGGWRFNDLQITSPLATTASAYPGGPSGPQLTVDKLNGTPLTYTWNCTQCLATTYYLHVYQDNAPTSTSPITNGVPIVLSSSSFSNGSSELLAFVSTNGAGPATSATAATQADISSGYAAYSRTELIPIASTTTCAGVTTPTFNSVFPQTVPGPPGSMSIFMSFCNLGLLPSPDVLDIVVKTTMTDSNGNTVTTGPSLPYLWSVNWYPGPGNTEIWEWGGGGIHYSLTMTVLWPDGTQTTHTGSY